MKLEIAPIKQPNSYGCVAAVLQMLSLHYDDFPMTYPQAEVLTKCAPDGAHLEVIGAILRRRKRSLDTLHKLQISLQNKHPIIACDNATYVDPHAILITGDTPKGFWTIDPAKGIFIWRSDQWIVDSTAEWMSFPHRTNAEFV